MKFKTDMNDRERERFAQGFRSLAEYAENAADAIYEFANIVSLIGIIANVNRKKLFLSVGKK